MPTINQLVRKGRAKKQPSSKSRRHLKGRPQRSAVVIRTYTLDPRKPNSGDRKVARVRFADGREVTAAFKGEGLHVREHDVVLIRGGRMKDVVGVNYEIVRGALNAPRAEDRRNSRSRYGTRK